MLTLGQKVPNESEANASGGITAKIIRGTDEFATLVSNENPGIIFKNEEGTAADRMMTERLRERLDVLAKKVTDEWPGKKLRVTEAWDESGEHSTTSTH